MPVIRKPNFSDITCDIPLENFKVPVGNEKGSNDLQSIPLSEYLENFSKYNMTKGNINLLDKRDKEILGSVQYCVLPLKDGECEFNVNVYNYQTTAEDPAVMFVVASSQGTSAKIVSGNQSSLYFNKNKKSCNYVAKRLKDVREEMGMEIEGEMSQEEQDKNVLFIFQIPLIQKKPPRMNGMY